MCPRCGMASESTLHALRDCVKVRSIWEKVLHTANNPSFFTDSCTDWLCSNLSNHQSHNNRNWDCIFGVTIWHVWRVRNNFVFKGKTTIEIGMFVSITNTGKLTLWRVLLQQVLLVWCCCIFTPPITASMSYMMILVVFLSHLVSSLTLFFI